MRRATYSGALLLGLILGQQAVAAEGGLEEAVLEVRVNETDLGESLVVLRGAQGRLLLASQDFQRLRLKLPTAAPVEQDGQRWYAPADTPGTNVSIDEAHQRALITAPAASFATTRLDAPARRGPQPTPAAPGTFLNYQLTSQQVAGTRVTGAFTELGLFAGMGVLTQTSIGRDDPFNRTLTRLDTTFTRDFPDRLQTLNLGDSISDAASWGNAVRFAGVRLAKNFGMRPDLLTSPLLSAGGMASVPSTVDVFVNNQLVSSSQLPPGPFVVDRLPSVSGTGDVSVVVRDALGREQVITKSFYSSSNLLAQGLSQWSLNLGKVREDYAIASNRYGAFLAEGSWRQGLSDRLTLEGHAEYLAHDAHAAGLNAIVGIGRVGTLSLTAAAGGDERGTGALSGLGFEHRGRRMSFLASTLLASEGFAQIADSINSSTRFRQRSVLQMGTSLGIAGSLSLAWVRQSYRTAPAQQTLSLTHSVTFGHAGTLNMTLTRVHGGTDSTSAYLVYVLPFGARQAATVSTLGGSGEGAPPEEMIATLTQSPPVGEGSGYRLSGTSRGNYDASWRQQFSAADLELEAARNAGIDGRSVFLSGAMTLLDGKFAATRSVTGSFAVVDVAGLPDVPVYVENQLTTHTDANGKALLFNLRPYEANRISILPEELPLDTTIESASTIMAPPYRSGVVARFPVERVRSATFKLVRPEGDVVPAGAVVHVNGRDFPVVLDGVVYVTGYDHGTRGEAHWDGGSCEFRIEPPDSSEPQPDLGTVRCVPLRRATLRPS
ncbi:MAG: fimbria/pilus outer membrane usher protein [Steroidobacteraceae bacterium]